MKKPVFSIIIPIYNTIEELNRCVLSLVCQSFDGYEIILVDDGSTDGSSELCDTLAEQYERIKTIHKKNGGCSEARNTGVQYAAGEYIVFVDSDDMWDDEKALEEINNLIQKENYPDVICFGVEILKDNGQFVKRRVPVLPDNLITKKERVKHLVQTNQYFSTSYVKILKKTFLENNKLYFIKGLLSEDIEWSSRILVLCENIVVYPKAFYKRIERSEGSITASIGKKNISDILDSIENGLMWVHNNAEDKELEKLYFEYWAYQYAMLYRVLARNWEGEKYSSFIPRLEQYKWLLKYDHVKKVRFIRILVRIFGIKRTLKILSHIS